MASHTQLEDMFGRRPKPLLKLIKRFFGQQTPPYRDKAGELVIMLGIKNEGRGSAKAPFLSLEVSPYKIHQGIDGNGRFGLPPLIKSFDVPGMMFGASDNTVIHSDSILEIAKIIVDIPKDYASGNTIRALNIKYSIAAEGIQTIQKEETISELELLNKFKQLMTQ